MPTSPSHSPAWPECEPEADDDGQPTCYDARNPIAPWLAASSRLTDDFDEIEFAREFVQTGGQATNLAGCRCASPASHTVRCTTAAHPIDPISTTAAPTAPA